jgi:hypothetical protein
MALFWGEVPIIAGAERQVALARLLESPSEAASPAAILQYGSKRHPRAEMIHSITSSARASTVGEMSMPRALAVVRLMTKSNLVGCSTGARPASHNVKSCRRSRRRAETGQ